MQSKLGSAAEASINIASGFVISYLTWLFVVPVFWPHLASSHGTAFGITILFTVVSWLRSYTWRRIFNRRTK